MPVNPPTGNDPAGDDPADELEAALDRETLNWRAENEGDKVFGRVIELGEVEGQYGVSPRVVVLTPDDQEVAIMGFGILGGQIYSSGVEVGDLFGVKYLGKQMSANGREYRNFKTKVLGPDGKPKAANRRLGRPDPEDEPPELDDSAPVTPPKPLPGSGSVLDPRPDDLPSF